MDSNLVYGTLLPAETVLPSMTQIIAHEASTVAKLVLAIETGSTMKNDLLQGALDGQTTRERRERRRERRKRGKETQN